MRQLRSGIPAAEPESKNNLGQAYPGPRACLVEEQQGVAMDATHFVYRRDVLLQNHPDVLATHPGIAYYVLAVTKRAAWQKP